MKIGSGLKHMTYILIVTLIPLFLLIASITLLISPDYLRFEYGRSDFPPDLFGLTQAKRLELALVSVAYLQRWEPAEEVIYMLKDQALPTGVPLYSESELQHMLDVKHLTDTTRIGSWLTGLVVLFCLITLLARPETRSKGYRAIMQGGLFAIMILSMLAVFILLGWPLFFTIFHQVLFPPGRWGPFAITTGLIRLFPERFWSDSGTLISLTVLTEGLALALLGFLLGRRNRLREPMLLSN